MVDFVALKNSVRLWISTFISILLIFIVTFLTYDTEYRWLGHAIISITGLILLIVVIVNGARLSGRIKSAGATNAFKLHRNVSVLFSLFMFGAFFFGLWITYSHEEELLSSVHGWLGLVIVILAGAQLIPCFAFKRGKKIKLSHMILGYVLAFLVVIQTAWGLEIAVVGEIRDLVMIHSVFGAIAALALTWVIIEMRYLTTTKGLARAKMASYIAAFFNIVGCWIVGGYYYLTVYGSQLKPIILDGSQPWAHRIIMETKEHVFLFLPVLSLTLMLMLVWLGKDQTLFEDSNARRAIIALAVLGLVMILVIFVFGALISNTANILPAGVE